MKFTIDPKCVRYTNIRSKTRQLSKKIQIKVCSICKKRRNINIQRIYSTERGKRGNEISK